jgi:hypothetical protein
MPFFTLNFYTKVLLLAILLAVGIWNRKFITVNGGKEEIQIASKQLKSATSKNVLATALNKF